MVVRIKFSAKLKRQNRKKVADLKAEPNLKFDGCLKKKKVLPLPCKKKM
jgi:hypothetical protein